MEAVNYRLAKSLSDLSGTDAYIHRGTIEGVFREMGNAFQNAQLAGSLDCNFVCPTARRRYFHVQQPLIAHTETCRATKGRCWNVRQ